MSVESDFLRMDVASLLDHGRDSITEWITDDADPTAIAPTMAAMANSAGGLIIMGVAEGKKPGQYHIDGVDIHENTIDRVLSAALSLDPPLIIPMPVVKTVDDKSIVVARIPSGMPHIYAIDGRFLIRDGGDNASLRSTELRRLLIKRGGISYETDIAPDVTIDDLDWDRIETYIYNLSGVGETSPEQILMNRGCLAKQGDTYTPTNAGILLFGREPQRTHRGADITAVRFAGSTMSDTFSRQDIGGALPDQIRRAETFLVDHLRKDVTLRDTMARKELLEYPMEAARELVVNAVAHRD